MRMRSMDGEATEPPSLLALAAQSRVVLPEGLCSEVVPGFPAPPRFSFRAALRAAVQAQAARLALADHLAHRGRVRTTRRSPPLRTHPTAPHTAPHTGTRLPHASVAHLDVLCFNLCDCRAGVPYLRPTGGRPPCNGGVTDLPIYPPCRPIA